MLRVTQAFADHAVGDDITDASAIKTILECEQAAFVVRVADPDPEPTKPALAAPQE